MHRLYMPDRGQILAHLEHLFGGDLGEWSDGLIEIAWTHATADENGRHRLCHARLFRTDEINQAADEAVRQNSVPGQNVYVGAALRRPGASGRCYDKDFYALTATYADLDDAEAAAHVKALYAHCPPSQIVVTGRQPYLRAQCWWRLASPITDPDAARAQMAGLAKELHGDATVRNPGRVMRLGGTVAWPTKPGRVVERTELTKPAGKPVAPYTADAIARAYEPIPEARAKVELSEVSYTTAPCDGPPRPRQQTTDSFFSRVNALALERRDRWVPIVLPEARYQPGTGAWRVTSRDLGRRLEEDISIHPDGIRDFGEERGKTAIDLVIEHGGAPDAVQAGLWLCERMGIDAASLGWGERSRARPGQAEPEAPAAEDDDDAPFSAATLIGTPPERQWIVPEWLPRRTVTSLYGDGGIGKTLLAQQLATAIATGSDWLGIRLQKGKALCVLCEDDRDEIWRRQDAINSSIGVALHQQVSDLWLWSRVGKDNVLMAFEMSGPGRIMPFFERLLRRVKEIEPDLLILDTAADLFGGNENNRTQVNQFIKSCLGRIIVETGTTILLLAHPSMSGLASGTGTGGSTAWNNSVRSRWYLSPVESGISEQRVLTRKKANYAKAGDNERIDLIWEKGVLVPPRAPDAVDRIERRGLKKRILDQVEYCWIEGKPYTGPQGSRPFKTALPRDLGEPPAPIVNAFRELVEDGWISNQHGNTHKRGFSVLARPPWA